MVQPENNLYIHNDMVFQISGNTKPDQHPLKTFEWAIITQLNGEKTVAQIGEILALTAKETEQYFVNLQKHGLLELVRISDERQPVMPPWIEELEYQLTFAVGPIASIILDDFLLELNRTRTDLEKRMFVTLIDWCSREITNSDKRQRFLKKILDFVQSEDIKLLQSVR